MEGGREEGRKRRRDEGRKRRRDEGRKRGSEEEMKGGRKVGLLSQRLWPYCATGVQYSSAAGSHLTPDMLVYQVSICAVLCRHRY
jgi:hypothetical protein